MKAIKIKSKKVNQIDKRPPEIIYQDRDYLIINKPAGILVHPDVKNKKGTLIDFLLERFPGIKGVGEAGVQAGLGIGFKIRPGIVHRLDKDTSGLMMVIRNNEAFKYFKNQFQERKIKKVYWALTHGKVKDEKGVINLAIGRTPKKTQIRSTAPYAKDKKYAQTFYRVLKRFRVVKSKNRVNDYTLLEMRPKTGRTHQIRVHLKALGHPIAGDKVYKFKRLEAPEGLKRMFLMSKRLEFIDRLGNKKVFEVALDRELEDILLRLKSKSKD